MTSSPTSHANRQPERPAGTAGARHVAGIVGIGASAGGLAALEQFFAEVPSKSGLAFIVVQHLDPTQKGMLAELLQRVTPLVVCEAAEQMRVAAITTPSGSSAR